MALTLGETLRKARTRKGMSQLQASVYVGISHAALQHAEKDRNMPRLDHLVGMCAVYGLEADDILNSLITIKKDNLGL